jgi:hypothetical protein
MTDFDVLVITAARTLVGKRREVLAAGVLPEPSVPASRVF